MRPLLRLGVLPRSWRFEPGDSLQWVGNAATRLWTNRQKLYATHPYPYPYPYPYP